MTTTSEINVMTNTETFNFQKPALLISLPGFRTADCLKAAKCTIKKKKKKNIIPY